jgi:hypothetical protein
MKSTDSHFLVSNCENISLGDSSATGTTEGGEAT